MPDIVRSWSARDQELQPIRTVLNPQSDLCISSAPEGHKGAGAVSLKTHIAAFSTGGSSQILSKGTRMKSGSAASFNPRRRCSASEDLEDGPNSLRFQKASASQAEASRAERSVCSTSCISPQWKNWKLGEKESKTRWTSVEDFWRGLKKLPAPPTSGR